MKSKKIMTVLMFLTIGSQVSLVYSGGEQTLEYDIKNDELDNSLNLEILTVIFDVVNSVEYRGWTGFVQDELGNPSELVKKINKAMPGNICKKLAKEFIQALEFYSPGPNRDFLIKNIDEHTKGCFSPDFFDHKKFKTA